MALEDATNPMQGVSGPGKFAKRTDLQYQPDQYGAGVEYAANKAGAPLATAQKNPMLSQAPLFTVPNPVTGLFEPTQRPDEPITHGISQGPGAGPEVLGVGRTTEKLSDTLAKLLPYDTTGEITILYQQAASRGL
jgi:hypothetical protein